jgi:hypothetical protein
MDRVLSIFRSPAHGLGPGNELVARCTQGCPNRAESRGSAARFVIRPQGAPRRFAIRTSLGALRCLGIGTDSNRCLETESVSNFVRIWSEALPGRLWAVSRWLRAWDEELRDWLAIRRGSPSRR